MSREISQTATLDHGALNHPRGAAGSSVPSTADVVGHHAADTARQRTARRLRLAAAAEANRAAALKRA